MTDLQTVGATPTPAYNTSVGDRPFTVCASDQSCAAPALADWAGRPVGDTYRDTWDSVAAQLHTNNPIAIRTEIERQLYAAGGLDAIRATPSTATPPPEGSGSNDEGFGAFVDGAIRGDFSDNDSWSKIGGQVAMGFVPIAGQIADVRDIGAAAGQIWRGEDGGWSGLGLATIGIVPGVGDLAKGVLRGGARAADDVAAGAARATDEVATAARKQIEMDGGRRGEWPKELNARQLEPNADYLVNGYRYATDGQGRVTQASGQLDLEKAARNGYQQRVAGRDDRLETDQGGHLIASIFNGPGDRLNLVPMDGNFNMGAWKSMENRLADALAAGKQVDVKIDVRYAGDTGRPDRFVVEQVIDGVKSLDTFRNQPGG